MLRSWPVPARGHRFGWWVGVGATTLLVLGCEDGTVAAADVDFSRAPRALGQAGWTELHTGGLAGRDSPSAGEDTAAALDAPNRKLYLYGGKGDENEAYAELWLFDLADRVWSRIDAEGPSPPPREDHTLVLDAASEALVLFGGEDGDTSRETWYFDLREGRWSDVTHETAPYLESHTAIWDPRGLRMVVYGGMRDKEISKDTWALDLDPSSPDRLKWSRLSVEGSAPPARREHEAVYDAKRHRMLIFGGRRIKKASHRNDLWALNFDDLRWSEVETTGERPDLLRQTLIGLDPETDTFVVFGGEALTLSDEQDESRVAVNDVWVLDLATGVWANRTPYPPAMYDQVGTYVPEYGGTLLYGGSSRYEKKEHSTWLLRVEAP